MQHISLSSLLCDMAWRQIGASHFPAIADFSLIGYHNTCCMFIFIHHGRVCYISIEPCSLTYWTTEITQLQWVKYDLIELICRLTQIKFYK